MTSQAALDQRATVHELTDLGFDPLPIGKHNDPKAPVHKNWTTRSFGPLDWKPWHGIGLRCGRQRDGHHLYVTDFDHRPEKGIDAVAEFDHARRQLPASVATTVVTCRSTSGTGRYIIFRSQREIPSGQIYNAHGQKIGDFLGQGRQVVLPTPDRYEQGTLADIPIVDAATLDVILQAVGYRSTQQSDTTQDISIDWAEVEYYLGNLPAVLKRVKRHPSTYEELHGDGGADRSKTRYRLACNLRKGFGYTDEEIAAILFHFDFGHLQEKGTKWLKEDIERCTAAANEKHPDVITTRSHYLRADAQQLLPQVERPKRGRPTRLTDEAYLKRLKRRADGANQIVIEAQQEIADALRVSVPTIRRIEARLQKQGIIERCTVRKGRQTYSYVAILSAIKNTVEDSEAVRSAPVEIAHCDAPNSEANVLKEVHTCTSALPAEPTPAPVQRPSLAEAVRAMRAAGAKTRKRVRRMLDEYFPGHPWSVAAIDWHFDAEREAERRHRAVERDQVKVRAATANELRRMARAYAWKHTDARKCGNKRQAYMWGAKAQLVEDEIAHRQTIGDWPAERPRKRSRSMPAPLLAYVEPEPAPPTDSIGLLGGCVSPQQPDVDRQPVLEPFGLRWDYLRQLFAVGEWDAIALHCQLRGADVDNVLRVLARSGGTLASDETVQPMPC